MLHLLPLSILPLLLLLLTQTLGSPLSHKPSQPLPLLIWHGLGDNYAADGLHSVGDLANATNPGTYIYYIRLDESPDSDRSATFLGNVSAQIDQVCSSIQQDEILSQAPSLHALGFSQGGLFLRALVQRCSALRIKNLVTFGSPHNGISQYQRCKPSDWLCATYIGLLKAKTWSPWVQAHLVPAQYFRQVDAVTRRPTQRYVQNSALLAHVNGERHPACSLCADRIAALHRFVMYMFDEDQTLIPKESAWFADKDPETGVVTPLRERDVYKEDWIGLRALDQKRGLRFEVAPGPHMQLSDEVLTRVFQTWFSTEQGSWDGARHGDEVMEL